MQLTMQSAPLQQLCLHAGQPLLGLSSRIWLVCLLLQVHRLLVCF